MSQYKLYMGVYVYPGGVEKVNYADFRSHLTGIFHRSKANKLTVFKKKTTGGWELIIEHVSEVVKTRNGLDKLKWTEQ